MKRTFASEKEQGRGVSMGVRRKYQKKAPLLSHHAKGEETEREKEGG